MDELFQRQRAIAILEQAEASPYGIIITASVARTDSRPEKSVALNVTRRAKLYLAQIIREFNFNLMLFFDKEDPDKYLWIIKKRSDAMTNNSN
jgi:hypothetical protein